MMRINSHKAFEGIQGRLRIAASLALLFMVGDVAFAQNVQSVQGPAGTIQQPGSQLLYLLDTGIRPLELGPLDPGKTIAENFGITSSTSTNFISVTNTHPDRAVTVQFAYYNSALAKVLDFLVVMTCNDTMLIDPFNYTIPGSTHNTASLLFGPSGTIPALPTSGFGNGTFLLTVTSVGAAGNDSGNPNDTSPVGDRGDFDDPEDLDAFADWLFPFELTPANLASDCSATDPDQIGIEAGNSNNNLTVMNASAISHNYLTGRHTQGVAVGGTLRSFRTAAWARPAVNASRELDDEDTSELPDQDPDFSPQDVVGPSPTAVAPNPSKGPDGVFDFFDLYNILDEDEDGDGPTAPDGALLEGSEEIWLTTPRNAALVTPANYFYLRSEIPAGRILETNCQGATHPDTLRCDSSNPFHQTPVTGWGAFNWTVLFPEMVAAADQRLSLLSARDDYNGSNSALGVDVVHPQLGALPGLTRSNAYCLNPASTYYTLDVFNNDEQILTSPQPLVMRFAVRGLEVFSFENQLIPAPEQVDGGTSVDFVFTSELVDFSLQDVFDMTPGGEVGLFLALPVSVNNEKSSGWIDLRRIVTRDFSYRFIPSLGDTGPDSSEVRYDGERGSFVTLTRETLTNPNLGYAFFLAGRKGRPLF